MFSDILIANMYFCSLYFWKIPWWWWWQKRSKHVV